MTLSEHLTWTIVSLMLLLPVQSAVRSAYQWRHSALRLLADFCAAVVNVFLANSLYYGPGAVTDGWCCPDEEELGHGVKKRPCIMPLPKEHPERVQRALLRLMDVVQEILIP